MKKLLTVFALAMASLGAAHAAESPFYGSVSAGVADVSNTSASDHSGMTASVAAGYRLTPAVSAEVSVARLPDISDSGFTAHGTLATFEGVAKMKVHQHATLFGKAGMAYTRLSGDVSASRYSPTLAIGVEHAFTKNVSAEASLRYIHTVAGTEAHSVVSSLGLKYTF